MEEAVKNLVKEEVANEIQKLEYTKDGKFKVRDNSPWGKIKRIPAKIGQGIAWGPKKVWNSIKRGAGKVKQGWQNL